MQRLDVASADAAAAFKLLADPLGAADRRGQASAVAVQELHDDGLRAAGQPPLAIAALLQRQTERLLLRTDAAVDLLEAIRDTRVRLGHWAWGRGF